jgi:hypothetical protein
VYDITVGYADKIVQTELELANSGPPMDIHFHIDSYSVDNLPKGDDGEIGFS